MVFSSRRVGRAPDSIERLVGALRELGAVLRDPTPVWAVPDVPVGPHLFGPVAQTVIFATDHGPVDVVFRPDGTEGYEDLNRNAVIVLYAGVAVRVASARDIVRSKTAANRAKDRRTLPVYEEWLSRRSRSRRA